MKNKKTSLEIKENILTELKKSPKTVANIGEAISSNWITTEKFLKELKEEKKVKELVSTEKKKVYQIITGDTYFNLPLTDEQRRRFRTLFYLILKTYSKNNKTPTKTQLSKCAVKVIKNPNLELSNLPVIWYLYGMIPVMVANPAEKYTEETHFKDEIKIVKIIEVYRNENFEKSSRQIDKKQHEELGDELYKLADHFSREINSDRFNQDKILDILNKFFIACPIDKEFMEVFEFTDKFVSTIDKLSNFVNLEKYKKEIISTFDSLWKFIATYKVYESINKLRILPSKEIILEFYVGNILEIRKTCFEESFSELYSIYLSNLTEKEIKLSEDAKKARDIMEGWTGED